jgi:hypothetical protein
MVLSFFFLYFFDLAVTYSICIVRSVCMDKRGVFCGVPAAARMAVEGMVNR